MKINEKLAYFSKVATQEAEQQRAGILAQIEEELTAALDEYTNKARKQSDQRIQSERYKIEQAKNKEIIQAAAEAKKSLIDLRKKLKDELFAGVTKKAEAFTQTEAYKEKLLREITLLVKRYSQPKVYLMEKDMDLAEKIPAECVSVRDGYIGGFKLFIPEKNAVEDHTYLARLRDAREDFNLIPVKEAV